MKSTKTQRSTAFRREGNIVALTALMLPFMLIISAMAINIAYLQLSRTELMVSTDAAARAGGRAMSVFQDIGDATTAAQVTATLNNVSGRPLQLDPNEASEEVLFGEAADQEQYVGRLSFSPIPHGAIESKTQIASAIQIHGKTEALPTFFPTFGTRTEFNLEYISTALQVDRDIALILDRSGSMDNHPGYSWPGNFNPWTTSSLDIGVSAGIIGTNGQFYFYQPGQNWKTYQDFLYEQHLDLGEPPKTPWEELVDAVDAFLNILTETPQDEQVSLASYATTATLDLNLVKNYDLVRNKLDELGPNGWTAIGDGMNTGIPSLLDNAARPFAAKTLVVMTDGIHNRGLDPDDVARSLVNQYDVTIHAITFGAGADKDTMKEVAQIGGGGYYHAATGAALQEIFEEIANNLPTIVIN